MKLNARFLVLLFVLSISKVYAQSGSTPPTDLRAQLRTLSTNEKLKLLEYMRYLGTSLDKEAQQTYEQLSTEKRNRVLAYIELQKQGSDVTLPATTVVFHRDTIHFGTIEEGTILLDTFAFTNSGKQPYVIKSVKTSCDCTVLKYPEFPVMPGETAVLRLEFDSNGKAGATQPGVIIYDNSFPNARNILYLKGTVSPRKPARKQSGG
jgi:hypothetical protein